MVAVIMQRRDFNLENRLETSNDEKLDLLHRQVSEMRVAAQSVHEEVKSSNTFLDKLGSTYDKGKQGLSSTIGKFDEMLDVKSNRIMLYVVGSLTILFLITWKALV
mmetsp:Transcript_32965/g.57887  ORF Transcript_32965/g.57887 Transcript_32965/m.57887 type:complete len:106 (+) Transcript_32965:1166-1483(+)